MLLGVTAEQLSRFTAVELQQVRMAVVLQLNFQAEQDLDAFILESEGSTQQGEQRKYRDVAVHPQAAAIMESLGAAGSPIDTVAAFAAIGPVRSLRTQGGGGQRSRRYGFPDGDVG